MNNFLQKNFYFFEKNYNFRKILFLYKQPDAQLPPTVPPLELHSVEVKQVPIIGFVSADKLDVH